jgi:hypothetical protein
MDAAIGGCGLTLNPSILDPPIFHGIAPEFPSNPDTVVGSIPPLDTFQGIIDIGRASTLADQA